MTPDGVRWYELPVPRWSDHVAAAGLQARALTTRRELLVAAARRFASQGHHGTSLTQVAADASRTKGALFFHFASKSALGWAVVDEVHASWDDLADRIAARDLDPLRSLLVVFDAQMARLVHDPIVQGGVRVMREDPGMQADRHKWVEGWRAESEVLLQRARAQGLLAGETDPASVSTTLLSTVVGHHYLAETQPDGPSLWERMTATWLGLLPTMAARGWLAEWAVSGWSDRPEPDPEAYARARRPA
ncbi:TetR family transcriptional regulator [Actinomycetospora sp. CA-101289]|uniref:TetR family transcriptional regulator n=1 Tax=Actinomycetospora sp. CA-101289 TaxID=3239893 RepID=UPI003D95B52D